MTDFVYTLNSTTERFCGVCGKRVEYGIFITAAEQTMATCEACHTLGVMLLSEGSEDTGSPPVVLSWTFAPAAPAATNFTLRKNTS